MGNNFCFNNNSGSMSGVDEHGTATALSDLVDIDEKYKIH